MTQKPYALSVKVIIRDEDGKCLLLQRSKGCEHNVGKWDMPGGKVDVGERPDEALLREVGEETEVDFSLDRVIGAAESDLPDRKVAYLIFEGRLLSSREVQLRKSEHDAYRWVSLSELGVLDVCEQFRPFFQAYVAASER